MQILLKADFEPTRHLFVDNLFYDHSLTVKKITMPLLTQEVSGRSILLVEKKKKKPQHKNQSAILTAMISLKANNLFYCI